MAHGVKVNRLIKINNFSFVNLATMINLKQIYFVITRRCNLFCSHCIRSSGPGITDYLNKDDFRLALEKIYPYAQNAQILISGGEPTLHKNFVEMCKIASELYPEVMVNTNGLRPKYLIQAHEVCQNKLKVQISIDGDEKFHDRIRGKGTFQRSLKAVEELYRHGIDVVIASTVGEQNVSSMYALDTILSSVNYRLWTIKKEVVYGRAAFTQSKLDTNAWNRFVKDVKINFKNQDRLSIATMFDWSNMSRVMQRNIKPNVMNCGTGNSKLYINPDLTVFPCGCLEQIYLGDLSKDSVETVIELMQEKIQNIIDNPICKLCPVNAICNGGCPGSSYNYFGQFGKGDPRCSAIHDLANK